MERLTVPTPFGNLIAFPSLDPDNPGIHVRIENARTAASVDLATVECRLPPEYPAGPAVQTHVWGDAAREDPTHDVSHENLWPRLGTDPGSYVPPDDDAPRVTGPESRRFSLEPMPTDMETVAARAAGNNNVCVMCDRRSHAEAVYSAWRQAGIDGIFFLAGDMPAEQSGVMTGMIRRLQDIGAPVHVACTPCIETGVDLDFEYFYRAIATVPHLVQASGRHNRHGKYPDRPMTVFVPEDAVPAGMDRDALETALADLRASGYDLDAPEGISTYFMRLRPFPLKGEVMKDRPSYKWKKQTHPAEGMRTDHVLELGNGLRLEVRQVQLRSETTDRAYDLMLFQVKDGMQSCLWHEDKVPETPGKDIRDHALERAAEWYDSRIAGLRSIDDLLLDAMRVLVGKETPDA